MVNRGAVSTPSDGSQHVTSIQLSSRKPTPLVKRMSSDSSSTFEKTRQKHSQSEDDEHTFRPRHDEATPQGGRATMYTTEFTLPGENEIQVHDLSAAEEGRSEDILASTVAYEKVKQADLISMLFVLAACAAGSMGTDAEVKYFIGNEDDKETPAKILLVCSSICAFFYIIALWVRRWLMLKWLKTKMMVAEDESFQGSGLLTAGILETIIALIHPSLIFWGQSYTQYNTKVSAEAEFTINEALSIIQVLRALYIPFRVAAAYSPYGSPRSQRVCSMNGARADNWFIYKVLIINHPYSFIGSMFVFSIIVGGYCFRVAERRFSEQTGQNFESMANSMWCVILTMTTVGYGDFYPVTDFGRLVGTIVCIWGVFLVSLMVVSFTNLLEFRGGEDHAYQILLRLEAKEELKKASAKLILYGYLRLKAQKAEDPIADVWRRKYNATLTEFNVSNLKMRSLYNRDSDHDRLKTRVSDLETDYEDLLLHANALEKSQLELESMISEVTHLYVKTSASPAGGSFNFPSPNGDSLHP